MAARFNGVGASAGDDDQRSLSGTRLDQRKRGIVCSGQITRVGSFRCRHQKWTSVGGNRFGIEH